MGIDKSATRVGQSTRGYFGFPYRRGCSALFPSSLLDSMVVSRKGHWPHGIYFVSSQCVCILRSFAIHSLTSPLLVRMNFLIIFWKNKRKRFNKYLSIKCHSAFFRSSLNEEWNFKNNITTLFRSTKTCKPHVIPFFFVFIITQRGLRWATWCN